MATLPFPPMPTRPQRRARAGFTVIEMVVTLLILTIVIVLTLTLFDANLRLAQVQTSVSDLQQNLRTGQQVLIRDIRAAGRGAMPMTQFPVRANPADPLQAVEVRNNIPAGQFIDPASNHAILPNTDVLIVRGALNQAVWVVHPDPGMAFVRDPATGNGTVTLSNTSVPGFMIPQSLDPLIDAINDGRAERLFLVSGLGDHLSRMVTLNPGGSVIGVDSVQAAFTSDPGTWEIRPLAFASMIEEYHYYIEDRRAVAGDGGSSLRPRLVRAHVLAGSNTPFEGNAANWSVEIADNVADMQVALGIDVDDDGAILDTQSAADEWLLNHENDDPSAAGGWNDNPLFYVRISTLAIAERPDTRYEAPVFTALEDHAYTTAAGDILNGTNRRNYRKRWLQTTVDLRNQF